MSRSPRAAGRPPTKCNFLASLRTAWICTARGRSVDDIVIDKCDIQPGLCSCERCQILDLHLCTHQYSRLQVAGKYGRMDPGTCAPCRFRALKPFIQGDIPYKYEIFRVTVPRNAQPKAKSVPSRHAPVHDRRQPGGGHQRCDSLQRVSDRIVFSSVAKRVTQL